MTTHRIETNNEQIENYSAGVVKSYQKVVADIKAGNMLLLNDGHNPRPTVINTYEVSIKF